MVRDEKGLKVVETRTGGMITGHSRTGVFAFQAQPQEGLDVVPEQGAQYDGMLKVLDECRECL
jgi:hypothetical protein